MQRGAAAAAVMDKQDVFGASITDFDPWGDAAGGEHGSNEFNVEGSAFGDFGDFDASVESIGVQNSGSCDGADGDPFFKVDDFTASTASLGLSASPDNSSPDLMGSKSERKPSSRRGRLASSKSPGPGDSVSSSKDDAVQEGEGPNSSRRRHSLKRRGNPRRGVGRSKSADLEIMVGGSEEGKDAGGGIEHSSSSHSNRKDPKEIENSTSTHGSLRDGLRGQRQSFRRRSVKKSEEEGEESPKEDGIENNNSKVTASARPGLTNGKETASSHPGLTSSTRRHSSSRRLVHEGGAKVATQHSLRNLYAGASEAQADADAASAPPETDRPIVSHSVVHKPVRDRRSALARGLSSTQVVADGEPRRRPVGRSVSMCKKLDGPSAGAPRPPRDRVRAPPRSKSTGLVGVSSRRLQKMNMLMDLQPVEPHDEPEAPTPQPAPPTENAITRRQRRRSSSIDGDLLGDLGETVEE
jgi:hypothetical protein